MPDKKKFGLIFFILLTLTYLPILQTHYLHTDDFFWSKWGEWNLKAMMAFMNPIGRPLGAFVYYLFSQISEFRHTYLARLFAVLNVSVIAYLLFDHLKRIKVPNAVSFLLSLLVVTLPPFQIFVSYVSTIPHGLSVLFSLLAYLNWRKKFLSIFLLFIAFCFNQVGALFFIVAWATELVQVDPKKLKTWLKHEGKKSALTFLGGLSIYYVVFRVYIATSKVAIGGKYDPTVFVVNYGQRAAWFWEGALFEASNLWNLEPGLTIPLSLFFVFAVSWGFEARKGGIASLVKAVLLLLCLPIGFAVSLASSGPSLEYRTYPVLSALCLLIPFLWAEKNSREEKKTSESFVLLLLIVCVLGMVRANKTVHQFFAFPDTLEFRYVRNQVRNYLKTGKPLKWVNVVRATGPIGAPFERHDFGEPTVRHEPNIRPFVLAALSETSVTGPVRITYTDSANAKGATELLPVSPDKVAFEGKGYPTDSDNEGMLTIDLTTVDFK